MENRQDILYMVIPCYNEQEVLPETSRQLKEILYDLMDRGKFPGRAGCSLSMTVPRMRPGTSLKTCTPRIRCFWD